MGIRTSIRGGRTASNFPAKDMYAVPSSATGTPYSAGPKRPILSSPGNSSSYRAATIRFVDVPMSVHMPPSIEAKESGMSSLDGEMPRPSDHSATSGMSAATIGVLLMKAESTMTGRHSQSSAMRMETDCTFASAPARNLITPTDCSALATMNMQATVSGPGSEKPWSAAAPGERSAQGSHCAVRGGRCAQASSRLMTLVSTRESVATSIATSGGVPLPITPSVAITTATV